MQYEETTWEFALRMASQLDAPLVADIQTKKPQLTIGIPAPREQKEITGKEYTYTSNVEDYERMSDAMVQDFSGDRAESYAYAYIGDKISINGKSSIIKGIDAMLVDGILRMHYDLMHAGGSVIGLAAPKTISRAVGRMINGRVIGVKKDKVKVWLEGIGEEKPKDQGMNEKVDWLFPFSTVYSFKRWQRFGIVCRRKTIPCGSFSHRAMKEKLLPPAQFPNLRLRTLKINAGWHTGNKLCCPKRELIFPICRWQIWNKR